jgi:hypothetical protein
VTTINIDARLEQWLDEAVFRVFEDRGITVTQAAKNMICYIVQAQAQEAAHLPPHLTQALEAVRSHVEANASANGTYFESAFAVYLEVYPLTAVFNVNRAVRLMAEMYFRRFGGFPCGPTGGSETGSDSGEGGSGSESKTGQEQPATAGAGY